MQNKSGSNIDASPRRKLGLALAGGGFRASLFHLGVLHRLAEMDLLRYVEVLSTVSGGSIIGALYILLLRKEIQQKANLEQNDYKKIVTDLDEILSEGIKKNLRTRLLMNPLGLLRIMLTSDSLGNRMSRIYERYIYKKAVEQLPGIKISCLKPGRFLLKDLPVTPGGTDVGKGKGFEAYNLEAVEKRGSVITHLILNAASLNSGMPFRFSSIEIGDPQLGYFRRNEIDSNNNDDSVILKRKKLLAEIRKGTNNIPPGLEPSTISLAGWWNAFQNNQDATPINIDPHWKSIFAVNGFPGHRLTDADFGELRAMKLCAWYILIGAKREQAVYGGLTKDKQLARFWEIFIRIDDCLAKACFDAAQKKTLNINDLLAFVLELYYLRSAEAAAENIKEDYNKLRIGEAVGASACFPPVFPPFIIMGIYDDLHVARLGLTDGGVYDNVGITALLEENCNYIIASDTSGVFDTQKNSKTGRIGMSLRIVSILMNNLAKAQRSELRDKRRSTQRIDEVQPNIPAPLLELKETYGLDGLAFFHINSPEIGIPRLNLNFDRKLVASLRTDLDGFGDVEIAALVNHGYLTADTYIRQYLKDTYYAQGQFWDSPPQFPKEMLVNDNQTKEEKKNAREKTEKILKVGSSRVFRSLCLGAPESWLFTLAVIFGSIYALWNITISASDIGRWIAKTVFRLFDPFLSLFGSGWSDQKISLGVFLLCIFVAVVVLRKLLLPLIKIIPLNMLRRLITIRKWLRSSSGNILLLLYGLPVFVALAVSVLGWISYIFYYKPFERVTQIRTTKP